MGKEEGLRKLGSLDYSVAGALSGFFSRFIGQPLDVVKIKLQIQNVQVYILIFPYYLYIVLFKATKRQSKFF